MIEKQYNQEQLSKINYKQLSNYDKIMFVFARGFSSVDQRLEAFLYVIALRNNNQEYINEIEKFGHDPNTIIRNKLSREYHCLPWYKVEFNAYGYIEAWNLKNKPDAVKNQLKLF